MTDKPLGSDANRETWLRDAIVLMTPLFEGLDYEVPAIRVACGWPHRGGTAAQKRCIGECWPNEAASDGVSQIFISPYLSDVTEVLATLVHEVVHAVVGCAAKHGKVFRKAALAVGLEGKMTATHAGEELRAKISEWHTKLGPYSHATLDLTKSPTKKQSTRMIKCECAECGYVCRTTKKWLEVGPPHCPTHGAMKFDETDNSESSDS